MKIEVNKYSLNPRWFVAGTKGSYGTEMIELVFSKEWDGLTKKINFIPFGGKEISIVYTDPIAVPYEVMVRGGTCVFGVSGYKGATRLLSVTGELKVVDTVASPDNSEYVPTPDEMTQVMEIANGASEVAAEALEKASEASDRVASALESVEKTRGEAETLKSDVEKTYGYVKQSNEEIKSKYFEIMDAKSDVDAAATEIAGLASQTKNDAERSSAALEEISAARGEISDAKGEILLAKEETLRAKDEVADSLDTRESRYKDMFSNALKGRESGFAILSEDASPYEQPLNVKIKGNSVQADESDIADVENFYLQVYPKNMIPKEFASGNTKVNGVTFRVEGDGGVTMNGTVGSDFSAPYRFYNNADKPVCILRGGVTYRLSCINGEDISVRLCNEGYSTVIATSGSAVPKTITPNADIPIYKVLGYFLNSKVGKEIANVTLYPMLEIAGEGEGFCAGEAESVKIPLAMRGVGNCADELSVNGREGVVSLKRVYESYEFSGDEAWTVESGDNTALGYIELANPVNKAYSGAEYQLCNRMGVLNVLDGEDEGVFVHGSRLYARISSPAAVSGDFNAVFKAGDRIIYPSNEVTEDLSESEWGKALLSLRLHPSAFTLDCDGEMTVDYVKDINREIERIYRAVISLGAEI